MARYEVSEGDRQIIRELAAKQAQYASEPVMEQRKRMWYALNDDQDTSAVPVVIETGTFNRDFLPDRLLRCEGGLARKIEKRLLDNVLTHEQIYDDKVIPDTFDIEWFLDIDEFGGLKIGTETLKDAQGIETGYRFLHPITDLERDLELLKPAVCRVDKEGTYAYQSFLDDLLGDLLPVVIRSRCYGSPFLTHRVVELMGMERFFMAMYDAPDHLHALMEYLTQNALRIMDFAEKNELLRVNNENQASFGSSFNFTRRLPAEGYAPPAARLCDMWGSGNSQETVGVSPAMYSEFCAPYYRRAAAPMGRFYYGCCEPAHPFWEDIRTYPHLSKLSISRWCDQNLMGETLAGSGIVFSRKPDPNFLSVDQTLQEDAWAQHIRESLEAARGCAMEIIIRDVYTVHGDITNAKKAVDIARREVLRARG